MTEHLVGVISDTHGLLRPEAMAALTGCEMIIHAGDVGRPEVLETLGGLAPVAAVRGNVDSGAWADGLPETEVVQVGAAYVFVLHDRKRLDLDPMAAGFSAVISGHSHKPSIEWQGSLLYLNPGAAGPRRFSLPVSVARLRWETDGLHAELVELNF